MAKSSVKLLVAAGAVAALVYTLVPPLVRAEAPARVLPAPAVDVTPRGPGLQTAVFAGGCFWGVQGVFEHVKGVTKAVSGYAGGSVTNPGYEQVSTGYTGHAESVSVALDPTEVNRQGPDTGTQYRSELFVSGPEQERVAKAYIAQLDAAHAFSRPIATRIDPAEAFYPAEGYHQDYLLHHPDSPYIARFDLPKVRSLQTLFPDNWREVAVTVR
jgi:peptide-methionine (S)-S-oxide reductase